MATLLEKALATKSGRMAHSSYITDQEMELLDAWVMGRITTTQAGNAMGAKSGSGHHYVTTLLIRAIKAGKYVRADGRLRADGRPKGTRK